MLHILPKPLPYKVFYRIDFSSKGEIRRERDARTLCEEGAVERYAYMFVVRGIRWEMGEEGGRTGYSVGT